MERKVEGNNYSQFFDKNENVSCKEFSEEFPLLFVCPKDNSNGNDLVAADSITTNAETGKNVRDTCNDRGYDRRDITYKEENVSTQAPPDIYIQRASSYSDSTASRLDIFSDQASNDVSRRKRKNSNRFLVSTPSCDELSRQQTSIDVPEVRLGDDDVFAPNTPPQVDGHQSLLQVPVADIFDSEPLVLRELPFCDKQESNVQSVSRISSSSSVCKEAGKIAEQGRRFANRQTERLIFKDGNCSVTSKNVPRRHYSWFRDIFTTFLDLRWRYNLLIFAATFVGSWFFFAILWWAIAVLNGDHLISNSQVKDENLSATANLSQDLLFDFKFAYNATEAVSRILSSRRNISDLNDSTVESSQLTAEVSRPCVDGVYDFITALLFSIETQQTIGYGTRYITPDCPHGAMLLMIQSCLGIILQTLMTGIVFSKLNKPKSRAHTMMFSRFAVICLRDDQYCLLFRVGDMRRSYLIGTSIRAIVMKSKDGDEKLNPVCQHTMELEMDQDNDTSTHLMWPITMVHSISESSPLWGLSLKDLIISKFEIVIVLEGTIEHTGMTAQFRTSYLPSEILWGHHLAPLLTYQKQNGKYEIDFTRFDNVTAITNMPDCSAKEFAMKKGSASNRSGGNPTAFATGGFKRNGSQSLWPRVRKILKSRDIRDDQTHSHAHSPAGYPAKIHKSATLDGHINPNSSAAKRRSADVLNNATRSLLRSFKQERPRSVRNDPRR